MTYDEIQVTITESDDITVIITESEEVTPIVDSSDDIQVIIEECAGALSGGDGHGTTASIEDHIDVTLEDTQDGESLVYDVSVNAFVNKKLLTRVPEYRAYIVNQ